jgi:hypothetical protein
MQKVLKSLNYFMVLVNELNALSYSLYKSLRGLESRTVLILCQVLSSKPDDFRISVISIITAYNTCESSSSAYYQSRMLAAAEVDSLSAIIRKRIAFLIERVRGSTNSLLKTVAARLDVDNVIMRHKTCFQLAKDAKINYNTPFVLT